MPKFKIQIKEELTEIHQWTIEADTEDDARATAYEMYNVQDDADAPGTVIEGVTWNSETYAEISHVKVLDSSGS